MVALREPNYITPQEYLEWEETAETKSEYHDGVIVAMAGADPEHNKIAFDICAALGPQLREASCEGFGGDQRVRVPACNKYFYPDVSIACEEPQYESIKGIRSLLNPTLIIEVLSASTERSDRGEKFVCYQTLNSLLTYVLVSCDKPRMEVYSRQDDRSWRYERFDGMETVVPLPAVGATLRLSNIYARVRFPARLVTTPEDSSATPPTQNSS